jgi:hypothetical protein
MAKKRRISLLAFASLIIMLVPVTPAVAAVEADIIFVVDESGSMFDEQAALGANIVSVATALAGAGVDGQYGLVGFGAAANSGQPVTELALTSDLTDLTNAIAGLTIDGFIEPGYNATTHALTDPGMGLRASAGTCVVLATDEPSNGDQPDVATALVDAQAALAAQGAFFFGLTTVGSPTTSYEPLATATGGAMFDLVAFNNDPAAVLNALLTTCVEAIVASGTSVDVHPTSCPNPFNPNKGGVVPAAILGSETLDVTEIDPSTVELTGPGGSVSPTRTAIEDVAGPDEFGIPEERTDCGTDGPDGYDDLTLKFKASDFATAVGPVAKGDLVIVTISGETFGGTAFSGVDIVWIR